MRLIGTLMILGVSVLLFLPGTPWLAAAVTSLHSPAAPEAVTREPAPGMFLVARRKLNDPHFKKTVIFILRHDEEGTLGLIVNRPGRIRLSDAVSGIKHPHPYRLYFGGPVEPSLITLLLKSAQELPQAELITGDVYFSANRHLLDRLLAEKLPENQLHFFLGHAGWTAGQLASELKREDWFVLNRNAKTIFSSDIGTLWQRLIEKLEPTGILVESGIPGDHRTRLSVS